jgi:hypothetical protein
MATPTPEENSYGGIPANFEPPVNIPDVFIYSIRSQPTCIEFESPDRKFRPDSTTPSTSSTSKKENKGTRRTRLFYKWVTQNNITPAHHRHILPSGASVEEFCMHNIFSSYQKRDFCKRRK